MLRLTGFLICPTMDEADRVSHLLPAELARWKAEPGCLGVEVWRSHEDPTRFAVLHRFADRGAYERHVEAARDSAWGRATAHLKRELRLEDG